MVGGKPAAGPQRPLGAGAGTAPAGWGEGAERRLGQLRCAHQGDGETQGHLPDQGEDRRGTVPHTAPPVHPQGLWEKPHCSNLWIPQPVKRVILGATPRAFQISCVTFRKP